LSKIESGSLELFLAPMSPVKVVTETVESLRSLAQEKALTLDIQTAETMPELVLGDARKIQQIVVNLVSNAVKFTSVGGITVALQDAGVERWQFQVQDTGIGIPARDLGTIFEPFRQGKAANDPKNKGTGLGLSISKRLVDKMGGTVAVATEEGKGTTFTVVLPRVSVPELAVVVAASETQMNEQG
jgi:signal transduction histidine kinase